jgi:hypothetical protein
LSVEQARTEGESQRVGDHGIDEEVRLGAVNGIARCIERVEDAGGLKGLDEEERKRRCVVEGEGGSDPLRQIQELGSANERVSKSCETKC